MILTQKNMTTIIDIKKSVDDTTQAYIDEIMGIVS